MSQEISPEHQYFGAASNTPGSITATRQNSNFSANTTPADCLGGQGSFPSLVSNSGGVCGSSSSMPAEQQHHQNNHTSSSSSTATTNTHTPSNNNNCNTYYSCNTQQQQHHPHQTEQEELQQEQQRQEQQEQEEAAALKEQELKQVLESWAPQGRMDEKVELCPELLDAVGMTQSLHFLEYLWRKCKESGSQDAHLNRAFCQAVTRCGRKPQARLVANGIVDHFTDHTDEDYMNLAFSCAELGDSELAIKLFNKSKGKPRPAAFYMCLARIFCETSDVDLVMATRVCDEMVSHGLHFNSCMLRLLFLGLARMKNPPIELAMRLLDFRLRLNHNLEPCMMHKFLAVVESCQGHDALVGLNYLRQLNRSFLAGPIAPITSNLPDARCEKDCMSHVNKKYYLCDTLTVDFEVLAQVPENSYLVLLYSSLRAVVERAFVVAKCHKYNRTCQELHQVLRDNPCRYMIIPLTTELYVRTTEHQAENSPSSPITPLAQISTASSIVNLEDKIFAFIQGFKNTSLLALIDSCCEGKQPVADPPCRNCGELELHVLSKSPVLKRRLEKIGIPCTPSYI